MGGAGVLVLGRVVLYFDLIPSSIPSDDGRRIKIFLRKDFLFWDLKEVNHHWRSRGTGFIP